MKAKLKKYYIGLSALLLSSLISPATQAATIGINEVYVDQFTLTVTQISSGISGSYSQFITPPAQIIMGSYQTDIIQVSNGSNSASIYTSGDFGAAAPSGTVDDVAGTIAVDFSSLRANLTLGGYVLDTELWPLTTVLDIGTFSPTDNSYSMSWLETINVSGLNYEIGVTLNGNVSLVPLPAAIWLIGSGLFTLVGFSARRRV